MSVLKKLQSFHQTGTQAYEIFSSLEQKGMENWSNTKSLDIELDSWQLTWSYMKVRKSVPFLNEYIESGSLGTELFQFLEKVQGVVGRAQ